MDLLLRLPLLAPPGTAKDCEPWVAQIVGRSEHFDWERRFLRPLRDWSRATKRGHGVVAVFSLGPHRIYEICERQRKMDRRYFGRVVNGRVVEISADEVAKTIA